MRCEDKNREGASEVKIKSEKERLKRIESRERVLEARMKAEKECLKQTKDESREGAPEAMIKKGT